MLSPVVEGVARFCRVCERNSDFPNCTDPGHRLNGAFCLDMIATGQSAVGLVKRRGETIIQRLDKPLTINTKPTKAIG